MLDHKQACDYERDADECSYEVDSRDYAISDIRTGTLIAILSDVNLAEVFRDLYSQWKKETWFQSSVKKRMSHPAYLKIIGMGTAALPLIFASLREEPDHWFGALEAITRENPAPQAENMYQLRDAWLEWAAVHGY